MKIASKRSPSQRSPFIIPYINRAPSQYPKRRLSVRSRKVSKPRDLYLELSDRFEIWQALRQQSCLCACQMSKRYDNLKYQSRGFETLRDLTERRLFGYWDGAQDPILVIAWYSDVIRPQITVTFSSIFLWRHMMTSSNGNIFRVTRPFVRGIRQRWIPISQRPVTRSFDDFFDVRLNERMNKSPDAGDLRCHDAHCDIIVKGVLCDLGDWSNLVTFRVTWRLQS